MARELNRSTVVAITSTLRGSPTEVELGVEEGLKQSSCANLANLFTVRQSSSAMSAPLVQKDAANLSSARHRVRLRLTCSPAAR